MICLKDVSEEKLQEIASVFTEAFLSEDGILCRCLKEKEAKTYFRIVLQEYSRIGALYALSENEEGYLVYHRKNRGPSVLREILMFIRFLKYMPSGALQKLILTRRGWQDYTVTHSRDRDYVDVSLVAVRSEYRRQGYLRKLLQEPFEEARKAGIPCILDTDSEIKAAKYMHVGMTCERDALLENGIHMYTLIRYPEEK